MANLGFVYPPVAWRITTLDEVIRAGRVRQGIGLTVGKCHWIYTVGEFHFLFQYEEYQEDVNIVVETFNRELMLTTFSTLYSMEAEPRMFDQVPILESQKYIYFTNIL
jgi:hypothetical protein